MTEAEIRVLRDLRGLRCAPPLGPGERRALQEELRRRVGACEWCTIGVMAPDPSRAWAVLRQFEEALGWPPLVAAEGEQTEGEQTEREEMEGAATEGAVFLKGHQRNGTVRLREEAGLGEGVLISGHGAANPEQDDTWGPLPLDLFAPDSPLGEEGATGP